MLVDRKIPTVVALIGLGLLGAVLAVTVGDAPEPPGPAPEADSARARGSPGEDARNPESGRDPTTATWDPGREATETTAAPVGMDPDLVDRAFRRADRLGALTSLLVARNGELVKERYWDGLTPHADVNIKSASKAVLSALVGLALRDGHLQGLEQPVAALLPEYFGPETDPRKRKITLRHLLTMTSGLETTSFGNYGRWVARSDWVEGVLEQPVVAEPGTRMIYSTGSSHLLSVILSRVTGQSTRDYAREELFEPLGIDLGGWQRDPQGYDFGGNNMRLSPRELLRFGQLYLDEGRFDGRRILPEGWVRESLATHTVNPRFGQDYGYLWWIREMGGRRVPYAWGYGGQFVFLVPDLELVVVTTSGARPETRGGFSHLRRIFRLVRRDLIPAAERGGPPVQGGGAAVSGGGPAVSGGGPPRIEEQ